MATAERVVYLGNPNAIQTIEDPATGQRIREPLPEGTQTKVVIPGDWPLMQAAAEITAGNSLWSAHPDHPAPTWVASDDSQLAQVLASHWGCELREPDEEA